MRYSDDGSPNPDFVLNKPAYAKAKIIVAGDNFGCGSSREHAPWALLDFGVRCVISTDFADIFYNNCFKNGVLPVTLTNEQMDELFQRIEKNEGYKVTVDLENQVVTDDRGLRYSFTVDPFRRECLLKGLDDIGLTLVHENEISAFEKKGLRTPHMYQPVDVKFHHDAAPQKN